MIDDRPQFSVIVVNYNGKDYLQGCIDSLVGQDHSDFETLIVDNASTDNSFSTLDSTRLKNCKLLPQKENLGFAKANNLAAKHAKGKWLVLLNPDAAAKPDWLKMLADATARYPETAMFASAQINMSDNSKLDGAGDCYHISGIPWRGGFERPISELPEQEGHCFGPCGASAVYRADCFARAGGFDEDFFCYVEDVDLAFRMRRMGQICMFIPQAQIYHKGSGIAGRTSDFSLFHGARNRFWTYIKNMPLGALILTMPLHIFVSIALLWLGMKSGRTRQTWLGMRAGIKNLPKMLQKRKAVNALSRNAKQTALGAMTLNPLYMLKRRVDVRPRQKRT